MSDCSIPIVSIKANSFFKLSWWTWLIRLHNANWLREQMHLDLLKLSPNCIQLQTNHSGHFVWVDQRQCCEDYSRASFFF